MALIQPSFDEVQDSVEAGTYAVRIVDSKVDTWSGKDGKPDTPYVLWTMETFNEEDPKNNGRKVFDRTPASGKGAFRLQNLFKAATGEKISGEFETTQLHSRELKVVVALDDKGYTNVKAYAPLN